MALDADRERLDDGLRAHLAGQREEAARNYRAIPSESPLFAHAQHYLGVLALQGGDPRAAIGYIRTAIDVDNKEPKFYVNLGSALSRVESFDEARLAYGAAIKLDPGLIEAHFNLGVLCERLGDLTEARRIYAAIVETTPEFAPAIRKVGALLLIEDADAAESFMKRHARRLAASFRQAWPAILVEAATILERAGQLHRALEAVDRATKLDSDDIAAWETRGRISSALNLRVQATAAYRQAHRLNPGSESILKGYAAALVDSGRPAHALQVLQGARQIIQASPALMEEAGNAWRELGFLERADKAYCDAIALSSPAESVRSSRLLALLGRDDLGGEALLAIAKAEGGRFASEGNQRRAASAERVGALGLRAHSLRAKPRIGFLSPDFYRHPVGYFCRGLFKKAREYAETVIYQDSPIGDALTADVRSSSDEWVECSGWSNQRLAERISTDRLDALVELAGHTGANRLTLLGDRLATTQISYLGYAGTLGVPGIDARLVDFYTDPVGADSQSAEKLQRMEGSYFCYQGGSYVGLRQSQRKRRFGEPIRFGFFGQRWKITDTAVNHWLRVIGQFKGARMLVRCKCFIEEESRRHFFAQISRCGGDPSRFETRPWEAYGEYSKVFDDVDVMLNSYPFHLATNMCDALEAGVPMVSYIGGEHRSRMGLSIATAAGMPYLCGSDDQSYLTAVDVALRELGAIGHSGFAAQTLGSPLLDAENHSSRFYRALQELL